jgi:AcrR family transcriptional regulator
MATKAGITLDQVVGTAEAIADRDGFAALSLAAVARDLGIRSPSLYFHVDGLPGLLRALMIRGAQVMTTRFQQAVGAGSGSDVVRELAIAYRRFAADHPGLYAALQERAPRPGEDDELYLALSAPVVVVADVLAALGVPGDRSDHLVRGLRAMLHGFVDIESRGGFGRPTDVDESFAAAVEMVITAIEAETTGDGR